MEHILIILIIIGFLYGLFDKSPSFWREFGRGFGEGMSSKANDLDDYYISFRDPKTGIGISSRIKSNNKK